MFTSQVIGNLGSDAVVKEISSKRVITFSVAHTDKNEASPVAEQTIWISVVCSAENKLLPYLTKGTKVYVSGRTRAKIYKDKYNESQLSITLYASEVVLCGSKNVEQR